MTIIETMHFEVSSKIGDNSRDPVELHRNKGNETLVVNNDIPSQHFNFGSTLCQRCGSTLK